jgi:rhodanese-related sulfurtransferase
MAEYFEFMTNHWMLSSAFGVVLVLFILNELKQRSGSGAKINPQRAVQLMNHNDAVIIDVRHPETFKDGHIVNSQNIPSGELADKLSSLNKHKQKTLILVCEQGLQSSKAANQLKNEGFEQVYFVSGGMMSWKAENLPLTNKD